MIYARFRPRGEVLMGKPEALSLIQSQPDAAATGETLTGTPSDDTLIGTPRDDAITGLGGDDTLIGLPRAPIQQLGPKRTYRLQETGSAAPSRSLACGNPTVDIEGLSRHEIRGR
jgi:hypothetical protein